MPTGFIHLIGIAAPAETIYEAITTEEGIRAWMHNELEMPIWHLKLSGENFKVTACDLERKVECL